MAELVSCIVATRDRPRFFRQALRYFLRQTYESTELVVIDDGEQSVAEACRGLDQVRYLRLGRPTATGTKLNIGIEQARGTILHKLDDDDYYHPDFLKLAVAHLPAEEQERSLVGWDRFLIWLVGDQALRYSGESWTAGGTLCFWRNLWEKGCFRDVPKDVDSWFLSDHQPRIIRVDAPEHHLVVRHGGNTWSRRRDGERVDDFLRRFPVYPKRLEEVLEAADCAFYRSLEGIATEPRP